MHIFSKNGLTVESEIIGIQEQMVPNGTKDIKVRSIKSTMRDGQNATLKMEESQAERLVKITKLRIGWLSCLVRERMDIKRWFRCQGFGHIRQECKGEDSEGDCLRCGNKVHKIIECSKETNSTVISVKQRATGITRKDATSTEKS